MNKLLTTIAMLCFSIAANADAYFCETLRNMNLLADGSFNPNVSRNDFVVDTEKGIRIGASENYLGSCSTIVGGISCEYRRGTILGRLYINSSMGFNSSFTFTSTTGYAVSSSAGTCTKA